MPATATTGSRQIARKSRSNLAFALACLPAERKRDMISFYAFCRLVDDIADDPSVAVAARREELGRWKRAILAGDGSLHPVLAEVTPLPGKYRFSPNLLTEIIDGVASDLDTDRYETMNALLAYCYKVASVVGLVSIEIFGYKNPACKDYAVNLGYALQLTNILRDVGQDARDTGRIYLPLEEMRKHGVTEQQVLEGRQDERFTALMRNIYEQARGYYDLAADQLPKEDAGSMIAARMMGQIYGEILEKVRGSGFRVLDQRVRLHPLRKGIILGGYLLRGLLALP